MDLFTKASKCVGVHVFHTVSANVPTLISRRVQLASTTCFVFFKYLRRESIQNVYVTVARDKGKKLKSSSQSMAIGIDVRRWAVRWNILTLSSKRI